MGYRVCMWSTSVNTGWGPAQVESVTFDLYIGVGTPLIDY